MIEGDPPTVSPNAANGSQPRTPVRRAAPPPTDRETPRSEPATQEGTSQSVLLGPDHTELGEFAITEVTPHLAIGISRGRFPKGYPYVDPNEDAAFAMTDGTTTVIAVVDGHRGFDAARAAVNGIVDVNEAVLSQPLDSIVAHFTRAAIQEVSSEVPTLSTPRDASRTALTVAAIRGDSLAALTLGDTACFVATRRRATRVTPESDFLGPDSNPAIEVVESVRLPSGAAVVVMSDGILSFVSDPERVFRSISGQHAPEAVETLISAAFAGGAGDNIASAVFTTPV